MRSNSAKLRQFHSRLNLHANVIPNSTVGLSLQLVSAGGASNFETLLDEDLIITGIRRPG